MKLPFCLHNKISCITTLCQEFSQIMHSQFFTPQHAFHTPYQQHPRPTGVRRRAKPPKIKINHHYKPSNSVQLVTSVIIRAQNPAAVPLASVPPPRPLGRDCIQDLHPIKNAIKYSWIGDRVCVCVFGARHLECPSFPRENVMDEVARKRVHRSANLRCPSSRDLSPCDGWALKWRQGRSSSRSCYLATLCNMRTFLRKVIPQMYLDWAQCLAVLEAINFFGINQKHFPFVCFLHKSK